MIFIIIMQPYLKWTGVDMLMQLSNLRHAATRLEYSKIQLWTLA